MIYNKIDPIIKKFADNHGLRIQTETKGVEIRALHLKRYTIFVDSPSSLGTVFVQLSQSGKVGLGIDWTVEPDFLYATLEKCLRIDEGTES